MRCDRAGQKVRWRSSQTIRDVGTRRDGGSLLVLVPGVLRVPDTADLERYGTPRERLERGQMAEGGHPER